MNHAARAAILAGAVMALVVPGVHTLAEEPATPSPIPALEVMDNAAVVALHHMGLGADVIVAKIQASPSRFDTSMNALKELNAAGVPDGVIAAMLKAGGAAGSTANANVDPAALAELGAAMPKESGVYLDEAPEAGHRLVAIEPSVYTQAKSGGFFKSAMTYGIAKIKSKAVLPGDSAHLRVTNGKPVFYFYFGTSTGNLNQASGIFAVATSPNEFVLARLQVRKNSRELTVGQANAFGAQGGIQDEASHAFETQKITAGLYKVTPKVDLAPGEYCFLYGGATPVATYGFAGPMGGGKVYDFSVVAR